MEYARQFCPPNKAPRPSAASSERCRRDGRFRIEAGLALERENQQLLFESDDAKEGLAAYLEKRPAKFTAK